MMGMLIAGITVTRRTVLVSGNCDEFVLLLGDFNFLLGLCPAGNYFSVLSSTCIPMSQVCDDQKQTSHGDDESNCCKRYRSFDV